MSKRINLILIYIGKLPIYFDLFLRSCVKNENIQWTLLTTEPVAHPLPENVRRLAFSLEDFERRVVDRLQIKPDIRWPYKLCDFRPAYGVLYPELVEGSDFWGFCDADVIFGDLRKFFPDSMFENQVKVQMRGALSFFKNDEIGNRLFTLPHPVIDYRKVFSNPKYCGLDEWEGIYKLMKYNGINFAMSNDLAEISYWRKELMLSHRKNYSRQLFSWENGSVLRAACDDAGNTIIDEYAYIHLQKRSIKNVSVLNSSDFAFLPGEIVTLTRGRRGLAAKSQRDLFWEMKFQVERISRYLRSLRTVDRSYWKVPK